MTLPSQKPRTSGPFAHAPRKPHSHHVAYGLCWLAILCLVAAAAYHFYLF